MSGVHVAGEESPAFVSDGARRYALTILMLLYVSNYLDRQIMSIVAEPIKHELHLADWQIGGLTGLAFALLYTAVGLPIARIADRANRPAVIGISAGIWAIFTMCSGIAQNFTQLALSRVGVGLGEAGLTPPALSLISDYTTREKRSSAVSFFMLGVPIGTLLGLALGGLIAGHYGWRAAMFVAGAPGLLLAAIAYVTLPEPRRAALAKAAAHAAPRIGLIDALRELAGKRSYWYILTGITLKTVGVAGTSAFLGSFFLRNHAQELAQFATHFGLTSLGVLGLLLGGALGAAGVVGVYAGGKLGDRYGKTSPRAHVIIPAVAILASVPFSFAMGLTHSLAVAMACLTAQGVLNALWYGPAWGAVQGLVRPRTRATASAFLLLISNMVGLGLGPLAVGALSDWFAGPMGMGTGEGLRWSIIAFTFVSLPCAWAFWAARSSIHDETVS